MSYDYEALADCVIEGDQDRAKKLTQMAIDAGADPVEIITQGLNGGMVVVGARFRAGEMFVPEVLASANAMSEGMALVKPLIVAADMPSAGTVVIGTVKGDLHDIGKNLVAMLLESAGFKVINIGTDIEPSAFVDAVRENDADVLGLSALLTTTMLAMKSTITALAEAGVRDNVKVIVGGAPVTQDFANEIGADGFAYDGGAAIDLCKTLIAARV
jgi:5-methyltetrahydrofolate--homocysteine methyltransferase